MHSLSMHIPTIFSDAFSLALNRTNGYHYRLLITGKGRGELVSTRENRNVQVSKLCDKRMMSQKEVIKYYRRKETESRIKFFYFNNFD